MLRGCAKWNLAGNIHARLKLARSVLRDMNRGGVMFSFLREKTIFIRIVPLLVLLAGAAVTFATWSLAHQDIQRFQQGKFNFRVNEIVDNIHARLRGYEQVLLGDSGLFAALDTVDGEIFRSYVGKLQLERNFPGMQEIGFSLLVPAARKNRNIEQIRRDGFPKYAIYPEGEREIYAPIVHLNSFGKPTRHDLGFDVYSDAVLRAAMLRAGEEGKTVISGMVVLGRESGKDVQRGFVMFVPVYRNGVPTDSMAERRNGLIGWVFSSFDMDEMMDGVLAMRYGENSHVLDWEVYDGLVPSAETLMYNNSPGKTGGAAQGSFHASRTIAFGQHAWVISVHSLPEFDGQMVGGRLREITYSGAIISILVAMMVWLLLGGRSRALALAEKMDGKFRESEFRSQVIVDNVLDGIITIDEQGVVESFNKAAERIFGYAAAEVIGNNVKMLMPEPFQGEHDGYLHNYVTSGIRKIIGIGREMIGRRKDGSVFPMDLAVTEMFLGERRLFSGIVRDITERKEALREVRRFKNVLDNTLDMIFMFDPDTLRFVYVNKGTVEMLGYSREELLGMRVWEIKPHRQEHVYRSHIAPLLLGDKPWLNYESLHLCKDGRELPVEVFLQLIGEEGGKRLFVAISRDLTERRKIDKMKSEFISTVSHELRTPLTSIRGSLGLVRGGVAGELPEQAKSMIEIAYNNSERLVRLINDILDMEKIESGKMHFDLKPLELMPLVEQAIEANRAYGEQHQVRFVLGERLPGAKVNVDADRLAQVLANFLSNAAKFSPAGDAVEIAVKAAGAVARVEVSDHGSGIPEEFHSRIFQKFSQADSSDTKQKGGTGLGLSISKAIVEKMGGVIGFDSEPGRGTTFFFELPRLGLGGEHGDKRQDALFTRVLVCEDNPDVAQQLQAMLIRRGYQADIADSAEEAKRLLGQNRYDAMTLDITLPGQDGLSLVRELQADEKTANLPIMVISAKASTERDASGASLNVLDWLDKPFQAERVFDILREQSDLALRHPVILHVEDDADLRQVLKALIGGKGEVVTANTLNAAKKMLSFRNFDLIILDVGLPDGSGLDLLPYLAEIGRKIPVMVFSAHEMDGGAAARVDAALVKSRTSNQQLLETIMSLVGKNESETS